MKKAKITRPEGFTCAPEGHAVVTIPQGAEVFGRVAEWAIKQGAGRAMFDPRDGRKVVAAPETKQAPKKRGRPRKKVND